MGIYNLSSAGIEEINGFKITDECLLAGNTIDDRGQKIEKLNFVKEYATSNSKTTELIFKLKFKSDFIGQQAAIRLDFANEHFTLGLGRLYLLESEYNSCLYNKEGSEIKAGLPTFKPDNFFFFKFVISDKLFEIYAGNNELNYKCCAYVHKSFTGLDGIKVSLGYKDTNPYDYHKKIKRGLGIDGIAQFYSITDNQIDNYNSSIANVYCRLTVSDTEPLAKNIKCALIGYTSVVLRVAKKYLTDSKVVELDNIFSEGIDFSKISQNDCIITGKTTDWLDISDIFAIPRVQQLLAFSLNTEDRMDIDHSNDRGNIKKARIKVEFANAKSDNSILKTVDALLDGEVLGLFIDGDLSDINLWETQIRTMNEYLSDIVSNYKAIGAAEFEKSKRFNINAHKKVTYFCNPFDKKSDELFKEIFELAGSNSEMAAYWPPEMPENPWSQDYEERFADEIASHMVMTPDNEKGFYVKFGDEPHIISLAALKKSEEGLLQFKEYAEDLYEKNYKNQFELPAKIEPIWINEVHTTGDAFLHLATIWFLQISTAKQYKVANKYIHEYHKGKEVCVGTDAYLAGFNVSPDYYIEAEYEAFDTQSHHYGSGDTVSPRQVGSDRYLAAMFDCAARYGNIRRGLLWFVCRIGAEEGVLLSGMTALLRQINLFHLYGCGPRWTGAEWFVDDKYKKDCFMAVREIFKIASEFEDDILSDRPYKSKAAIIFSRSACIWAEAPDDKLVGIYGHEDAVDDMNKRHELLENDLAAVGFGLERKMMFNVLSRNCYLPDILPEEKIIDEYLNNYEVLYLTDTHLSLEAQNSLARWVYNGGHLFIGVSAGEHDELNRSSSLLNKITGIHSKINKVDKSARAVVRGMGGEIWTSDINFSEEDAVILEVLEKVKADSGFEINAYGKTERLNFENSETDYDVIASFEDNTPAIIKVNIGSGKVYKSAICLGASYANSANPGFNEFIDVDLYPYDSVISGRTAHYKQNFDLDLTNLLLMPATQKNIYRSIKCSKEGLDINYFENYENDSAIILIANYSKSATDGVKIEIEMSKQYKNVKIKYKDDFSYEWYENRLCMETRMNSIQVIHLTNKNT